MQIITASYNSSCEYGEPASEQKMKGAVDLGSFDMLFRHIE